MCDAHVDVGRQPGYPTVHRMHGNGTFDWSSVTQRKVALSVAANRPAQGRPKITGEAEVGQTLTVDLSEITDPDGFANGAQGWEYAWKRTKNATETTITGATASTYTLDDDDEGATLTVTVTFTDDLAIGADGTETRTSERFPKTGTVEADMSQPVYHDATTSRTVEETFADGTDASARDVGDPVQVDEGRRVVYTLEGPDAASFSIDEKTGQLRTKAGQRYDHEAKASHAVTVRASNGALADTIAVTVNIGDVAEKPPDIPTTHRVRTDWASATSAITTWEAVPDPPGRPPITGYDVGWSAGPTLSPSNIRTVTASPFTITGLGPTTSYEFLLRTRNDEGVGDWVNAGRIDMDPVLEGWRCGVPREVRPISIAVIGFEGIGDDDPIPTISEGTEIVGTIGALNNLVPGQGYCDVPESLAWAFDVEIVETVPEGQSPRVDESHLAPRTIRLWNEQPRVELRIPTIDNETAGRDSTVVVRLTRAEGTHSQARVIDTRPKELRVRIGDRDASTLYFDHPCDEPLTAIEGHDEEIEVRIKRRNPSEYSEGGLRVASPGTAGQGNDFLNQSGSRYDFAANEEETSEDSRWIVEIVDNDTPEGTETFEVLMFNNGLRPETQMKTCSDPQAPSTGRRATREVTILDDDHPVTLDLGPATRTVTAGETIVFTPQASVHETCSIPFGATLTATPAGATEALASSTAASREWESCPQALPALSFETEVSDTGAKTVTFTFSSSDTRVEFEHPSYTVTVEPVPLVTLDLGPRVRTVPAGETVTFTPKGRDGACPVPIGASLTATPGSHRGGLVSGTAVTETWARCEATLPTLSFETVEGTGCGPRATHTVRVAFASTSKRVRLERDEYVVQIVPAHPFAYARELTTGTAANGYAVLGMDVELSDACAARDPAVEIWNSRAGPAGSQVPAYREWRLARRAGTAHTYDPPSAGTIRLEPSSTYFVVASTEGATRFAPDTAQGALGGSDTVDVTGWTVGPAGYERAGDPRRLQTPPAWETGAQAGKMRVAIRANVVTPGTPSDEPATADVEWKTKIKVGSQHGAGRERFRGYSREQCIKTREPTTEDPIEGHLDDDPCYGTITDSDFELVSNGETFEYTIESLYHSVEQGNDELVMKFTEDVDIEALHGHGLLANGTTYRLDACAFPRGCADGTGSIRTDQIVWTVSALNAVSGWPRNTEIWIAIETVASQARAVPGAQVTRTGDGPVHGPFGIEIAFTEDVTGLEATDLALANASVVEGTFASTDARTYTATIAPTASGTVTVQVPAGAASANGTASEASAVLSVEADLSTPSVTLSSEAQEPVSGPFAVRIAFSKAVEGFGLEDVEVTGGEPLGLTTTPGGTVWNALVQPDPRAATVSVEIPAGAAQDLAGRQSTVSNTLALDGPGSGTGSGDADPEPTLTASFRDHPPEHRGSGRFELKLAFSEEPQMSWRTVAEHLVTVSGGTLEGVARTSPPKNLEYTLTVAPDGDGAVTVSTATEGLGACGEAHQICTGDGRALEGSAAVTVPGPVRVSAHDASVREGAGAKLAFRVTLDRARHAPVSVGYATSDGTGPSPATEGQDYRARSGTLTFDPEETEKTIEVEVLEDAHDDGGETVRLTLSDPAPAAYVRIEDAQATGTIENDGPMPQAWLARFGRTVAEQVLDAVESRMEAPRSPGAEVSLGGQRIGLGPVFGREAGSGAGAESAAARAAQQEEAEAAQAAQRLTAWLAGEPPDRGPGRAGQAVPNASERRARAL